MKPASTPAASRTCQRSIDKFAQESMCIFIVELMNKAVAMLYTSCFFQAMEIVPMCHVNVSTC